MPVLLGRWRQLSRRGRALLVLGVALLLAAPAYAQFGDLGLLGNSTPPPSMQERITQFSDPSGCWGCNMFNRMAVVADQLGRQVSSEFAGPLRTLLQALMGVWVLFRLTQVLINTTGATDTSGIIQDVIEKLFVFVFLMAILSSGTYDLISRYFISPFFEASAAFARRIMAIGGVPGGGECGAPSGSGLALNLQAGYQMMCALHRATGVGLGIGRYLIDMGYQPILNFNFGALFAGVILMIVFFILSVLLPFRLFDSLIRLVTVCVILPVLVVATQFRVSRGAARQGAASVIVACLNFVFVAVAVAISLSVLVEVIEDVQSRAVGTADAQEGFGPVLVKDFMLLLGMGLGMMAFVRMAGSLAAEFAGFQGQQGEVGATAAGAIAKSSAAGVAIAGYAAGRTAGAVGSAIWQRVR